MVNLDLKELVLNIFKEDKLSNERNTIFSQLALITIKSLMPNKVEKANRVDYSRFGKELELLKYYKVENENNKLKDINEQEYSNNKDKTVYARILPIIVANKDYEVIEEEVVKNILYTSGDVETLLETLVASKFLSMIVEENNNLLDDLRQYIINLSQVEFLDKYGEYYLHGNPEEDPKYKIKFEKSKIDMISILHGKGTGKYGVLVDLVSVINGGKADSKTGHIVENAVNGQNIDCEIDGNYKRMALYVVNLREGKIDPKDLKIEEYKLPDIFSFEEGETFFHSLLSNSKVIKKETKNDSLISLIQTKSGMYLFKKDPFN